MKETREFIMYLDRFAELHEQLPDKVGALAVRFFKKRFEEQAWVDIITEPWKEREGNTDPGRGILVKSGRTKRSIRKIFANREEVMLGTDVPYAQVHNEGFRGTVQVKAHTRRRTGRTGRTRSTDEQQGEISVSAHSRRVNYPRRQFMGQSAVLNRDIERFITAEYMKFLRA